MQKYNSFIAKHGFNTSLLAGGSFIQLCLQNNGKLSERKRSSHFEFLSDEELAAMEQVVRNGYS
jgi:uncharacterized protein YggL (DUF469 family)